MERQFLSGGSPILTFTNRTLVRVGTVFIIGFLAACQVAQPPVEIHRAPELRTAVEEANGEPEHPGSLQQPAVSVKPEPGNVWQGIREGYQLKAYFHHPRVIEQIPRFESNQVYFDLVGERARYFLFGISEIIADKGMPQELALVPFIESTFDPHAYSSQHAVGLWQFLGPTGRSFGLQLDWWYDGRRDPFASTRAATLYFEQLLTEFEGNWLLALSAYNAGSANVRRALRRANLDPAEVSMESFWTLRLPGETHNHVARVLALAAVVDSPDRFGIQLTDLPYSNPLAEVDPGAQIDLGLVADWSGLELSVVQSLNPGYRQWATHPDSPHLLYLPLSNLGAFQSAIDQSGRESWVTWDRYLIARGDTLGAIAQRFDTRVDVLQVVNGLSNSRIVAGESLLIPRSIPGGSELAALARPVAERQIPAVPEEYTVRRGDNLWSIARRFDLRSARIALLNNIELDSRLMPGQVLKLNYSQDSD